MKFILSSLIFAVFSSFTCFAQNYQSLIEQGDSLFNAKKYDSSFYTFEEAIEAVSKLNVAVPEDIWVRMFMGAGNAAAAGGKDDKARKYWNLAKGSKGERLQDKIAFLISYGLRPITITKSTFAGTAPFYPNNCTSRVTSYLFWTQRGDVFVQKFDECDNYMSLKFKNIDLVSLMNRDLEKMKLENLGNVNNHGNEEPIYKVVFYTDNTPVDKIMKNLDLIDPRTLKQHDENINPELSLDNYQKNIALSLSKLLTAAKLQIEEYELKLSSPIERLKIGTL